MGKPAHNKTSVFKTPFPQLIEDKKNHKPLEKHMYKVTHEEVKVIKS